jgi:hypothetical protein
VWFFLLTMLHLQTLHVTRKVQGLKPSKHGFHYPTWGDNTYGCLSIAMNFLQLFHRILFVLMMCEFFLPFQQLKYMFIIKQWTNKWYIIFLECQFFPKIPCSIREKSMMCKLGLVRSMLCMWGSQVVVVHIRLANKSSTCIYKNFLSIYGGDDLTMYNIHTFND